MDYGLEGKVAVVTGAASGIGRAVATGLGRAGARVVAADVSSVGGEETVGMIGELGGSAVFEATDVTVESEVKRMVDRARREYRRLDIAFNNAGIALPSKPIDQIAVDDYERLMEVNVKGVWLCMKYEIPVMAAAGSGVIVNTSSTAGLTAFAGGALYCASKHAVLGMTRGAALDYAQSGIRINAINPGAVSTPMVDDFIELSGGDPAVMEPIAAAHPVGRLATADEIAAAVLWLCSEQSSFVTGQPLVIDGGFTAQ